MLIGAALPITILSIVLLLRRWRGTIPQWIALLYSIIVTGLASGHLACIWILTFDQNSIGVQLTGVYTYNVCLWLSDSFLVRILILRDSINQSWTYSSIEPSESIVANDYGLYCRVSP
jgi:hypothetical protein